DEEDEEDSMFNTDMTPPTTNYFPEVKEPQESGVRLLIGGNFGRIRSRIATTRKCVTSPMTWRAERLQRPYCFTSKEEYAQNIIPNTDGTAVASYNSNIYTGQFSEDSSFYYTCAQDFRLHIFDTTSPPVPSLHQTRGYRSRDDPGLMTTMNVKNTIQGRPGRWTITDANLSPDNQRMIYSSITPTVYMTSTTEDFPQQIPLYFANPRRRGIWDYDSDMFGIWSCRFSADGKEVVAGGDGHIFVYDLDANRKSVSIQAHTDDINSCCWADTSSGNVLVSASDDTFIKVWSSRDRRSLGSSSKPAGVLVGHTEGVTYVSPKGDGRYVISNGKDQAVRLWDLRKMRSSEDFESFQDKSYSIRGFDYRYSRYPPPRYKAHPKDCSVMTYRGHAVLHTLIRCRFSPAETTGGKYIYSGSFDGRIHIWSLDGRVVQVLDRANTLPMSFDPSAPEVRDDHSTQRRRLSVTVRDVSWHSQEPVLLSAGWEGNTGGSIVARHEWKGLTKLHGSLEDWVEKSHQESKERPHFCTREPSDRLSRVIRSMPGGLYDDGVDSDEG
ncbi:WD40 repeat-like protein, partial [Fistulina hepatica ATCC 64428]